MRGEAQFTMPEIARVLGTRVALGVGLGFLLANRFSEENRRAVGWTLLLVGAFSATSMAWEIFGRPRSLTLAWGAEPSVRGSPSESEERLGRRDALAVS